MPGPLEGLRVVELALAIQGPAAGLYFANMGAEVIKVEPPFGDASRYHRGINNNLPEGALGSQFIAMNKGKRSVTLDIHSELGDSVMHKLLATADVFLTNYRASALTRMNLDLHELTAKYPNLVVGHANGFGPLGKDADKMMQIPGIRTPANLSIRRFQAPTRMPFARASPINGRGPTGAGRFPICLSTRRMSAATTRRSFASTANRARAASLLF